MYLFIVYLVTLVQNGESLAIYFSGSLEALPPKHKLFKGFAVDRIDTAKNIASPDFRTPPLPSSSPFWLWNGRHRTTLYLRGFWPRGPSR